MDLVLTELQLEILCVLWTRDEATVAEIHEALGKRRDVAGSTVHTLLSRLEKRGVVAHRSDGKRYYFSAALPQEQVKEAVVREFCHRTRWLFQGSPARIVDWLLKTENADPTDRGRVRKVMRRVEASLGAAPATVRAPSREEERAG